MRTFLWPVVASLAFLGGLWLGRVSGENSFAPAEVNVAGPALPDMKPGKFAAFVEFAGDQSVAIDFTRLPGCRVDVILTQNNVPKLILEDVLLLAVTHRAGLAPIAAIELDNLEQAKKLDRVGTQGSIHLVLRPPAPERL